MAILEQSFDQNRAGFKIFENLQIIYKLQVHTSALFKQKVWLGENVDLKLVSKP